MNPAACARAKKAERLAREAAMAPPEPRKLPATPDEAREVLWREYRRATRNQRSLFRGVLGVSPGLSRRQLLRGAGLA